jgi:hypothetical protein
MVNIHCKKENCISDKAFFELIIPSLVSLLKIVCNIDLDLTETPFKQDLKTTGGTLNISYKCQYCKANISLRNDVLSVSFNFFLDKLEQHKIPLNSQRCNIHVENDLTFKHAEFNYYANFQKLKIDPNSDVDVYSSLNITQTIDSDLKKANIVSYLNGQTETSSYLNLKDYGLNPTFLKADANFDSVLVEMMTFCEKKPQLFFSVFSEYPSYVEFMESIESAVKFLNLFHGQYTQNYDILASRILLLHMQVI